jgi:hypothetical protein
MIAEIAELRAALAARATPAQPVLIQALEEGNDRESDRWFDISEKSAQFHLDEGYKVRRLYEHPVSSLAPSPSSVGAAIRALPLPEPVDDVQAWFRGEWEYVRPRGDYYTPGQVRALLNSAAALVESTKK